MPTTRPVMAALADDLTGAVETAGSFASSLSDVHVVLHASDDVRGATSSRGALPVIDLDCRYLASDGPRTAALEALAALSGPPRFVKVDSLLRGNIAPLVGALTTVADLVVFAPSLPVLGRVVCGGVPLVDGQSLDSAALWCCEARAAPTSVVDALAPVPSRIVPLASVRSPQLGEIFRQCATRHVVAACDAVCSTDLAAIVAAARDVDLTTLVGSGGLAQALASSLGPSDETPDAFTSGGPLGPLLVVTASREPDLQEQLAELSALGIELVELAMTDLDEGRSTRAVTAQVARALTTRPVVLRSSPTSPVVVARRGVAAALGSVVHDVGVLLGSLPDLFLVGGETTRRVLEACGIRRLRVVDRLGSATVRCRAPGGVWVVVRPGSYGPADPVGGTLRALGALGEGLEDTRTRRPGR